MPAAHLRFTDEDTEVLKAVCLFSRGHGKVLLAVEEVSKEGKKHMHLLIETSKTISTFGQQLSKAFPAHVGNGAKSLGIFKKDYHANYLYCCKGLKQSLPIVYYTILTDQEVLNFWNEYWQNQAKFVAEHKSEKKRIKVPTFVEKVSTTLDEALSKRYVSLQHHNWIGTLDPVSRIMYNDSRKEIAQHCILNLGQAFKVLDDSIVRKLINGVLLSIVTIYGNKVEKESYQNRVWSRTENDVY